MNHAQAVFRFLAVFSMFFAFSAEALQQAPARKANISGVVLNEVTGDPLSGVQVAGPPIQSSILSDNIGHFLIDDLEPGLTLLTFQKPGFVDRSIPFTFTAGQNVKDANVRMEPTGVVSGHLANALGVPQTEVIVTLFGYHATPGGREMVRPKVAGGLTDDRGEFRLFDVPPGRYLLAFEGTVPREESPSGLKEAPAGLRTIFPTMYPGVSEISDAETIEVKGGEETRLRNVTLQSRQGIIRIHFINGPGEPARNVDYKLSYETHLIGGYGQRTYGSNTLQIGAGETLVKDIWPGQFGVYAVIADWKSADRTSVVTISPMEFSGATSNINIELSRPNGQLRIHGTIQQADGTIGPLTKAAIGICRAVTPACASKSFWLSQRPFSDLPLPAITTSLGSDGSLDLKAIVSGMYELYSLIAPDGFYIASAKQADRNVLTDGITISEDSPSLEIQVRPNAGILEGQVTDRENRPVQSALVALLPDSPLDRSKLQMLRKVARTDQSGSFELRNVIPGDYHAYAWIDIQGDAYLDEKFVAAYRDRGVPVHIKTDHLGTDESMNLSVLNQQ
jgi:hypothetical protein